MESKKRPLGRPVSRTLPDPIPDTPENVARAILFAPPKKDNEWRHGRMTMNQTRRTRREDIRNWGTKYLAGAVLVLSLVVMLAACGDLPSREGNVDTINISALVDTTSPDFHALREQLSSRDDGPVRLRVIGPDGESVLEAHGITLEDAVLDLQRIGVVKARAAMSELRSEGWLPDLTNMSEEERRDAVAGIKAMRDSLAIIRDAIARTRERGKERNND